MQSEQVEDASFGMSVVIRFHLPREERSPKLKE